MSDSTIITVTVAANGVIESVQSTYPSLVDATGVTPGAKLAAVLMRACMPNFYRPMLTADKLALVIEKGL